MTSPTVAPVNIPTEPPNDCCDLPATFDAAGTQYGMFADIVDQNNEGNYNVTINYSPDGIITTYPQLACGNNVPIEPSLVAEGRLEWTERIEFGRNCIDRGRVTHPCSKRWWVEFSLGARFHFESVDRLPLNVLLSARSIPSSGIGEFLSTELVHEQS
jgi:hypothetical protein